VPAPAAQLLALRGIGPEAAATLWSEGLFRTFNNRKQVAAWRLWAWCRTDPLRACAKPC